MYKATIVFATTLSSVLVSEVGTREGLNLRVSLFQSRFVAGEPIIASVELRHGSRRARVIPMMQGGLDNALLSLSANTERPPHRVGVNICNLRIERLTLNPGASFFAAFNLLDQFTDVNQPGVYHLSARISPHGLRKNLTVFTGRLDAKPATFEVVAPRGIDADAYRSILAGAKPGYDGSPGRSLQWIYTRKLCEEIISYFPESSYAKYAEYNLAEFYQTSWADKALELYTAVVRDYPAFAFTPQAQWGIARCHFLKKEYTTAWREAEKVVARFPRTYAAEKAVKLLAEIAEKRRADSTTRN